MTTQNIYATHWLYDYIPHHRNELSNKTLTQKVMWAVFGNDDDGIFGEGPKSGHRWTGKWGEEISCRRFLAWQLRNPLHNFTGYVIGFKGAQNVTFIQLALITTKTVSFCQRKQKVNVFPMNNHSGLYLGLHNYRPFFSMRMNLRCRWLESYIGWRPNGGFGLAFRLKHSIKIKKET